MSRTPLAALLLAALVLGACTSDDDREDLGEETYLHNAQQYMDGGHHEQALASFRLALDSRPSSKKARLGEVSALYWIGAKENPGAGAFILEAEEKADKLEPEDYGENAWKVLLTRGMIYARLADLWNRKADAARKSGEGGGVDEAAMATAEKNRDAELGKATTAFESVLAAADQPLARNNLSALYFLAREGCMVAKAPEDYEKPIGFLRRYEEEVGKSKKLWRDMAKREPELAEMWKAKLHSAETQEIELRDLVANILFKQRRHEESVAELDQVIALDPSRPTPFFNRGRNHEELGRFGAAADDYRKFLMLTELPPGSAQVIEAAERKAKCERALLESLGK